METTCEVNQEWYIICGDCSEKGKSAIQNIKIYVVYSVYSEMEKMYHDIQFLPYHTALGRGHTESIQCLHHMRIALCIPHIS